MVELMALMAAPIVQLIAPHMLDAVALTAPQTALHTAWMMPRTVCMFVCTAAM